MFTIRNKGDHTVKIRPDRDIGSNIQKARIGKGLTQDQVVAKLQLMEIEISRSTYAKIETNRINIRTSELIALASIFEVDFNFFFQELVL
ncbi:MAG: helix-turn-helix transcriptional regulator [Clostridia bacterium]|nr:helix-turn-helix transcriptional regulator [Clostridia bacterium]